MGIQELYPQLLKETSEKFANSLIWGLINAINENKSTALMFAGW